MYSESTYLSALRNRAFVRRLFLSKSNYSYESMIGAPDSIQPERILSIKSTQGSKGELFTVRNQASSEILHEGYFKDTYQWIDGYYDGLNTARSSL